MTSVCCSCCNKTVLFLACLALLAAPWMIQAGHRGDIEEVRTLDGSSGVSEFQFRVVDSTRWARLSFRSSLTAGKLFVELVNPRGEALSWAEFVPAEPGARLKWSDDGPARGLWTLRVNREGASGRFEFEWHAR